jgi:hypothetical protein
MSLVDKMKAQAEQAAAKTREGASELQAKAREGASGLQTKARESVDEIQTKRDLAQAESELGRIAFDLADRGEIGHAQLTEPVQRVKELKAHLAGDAASPADAG